MSSALLGPVGSYNIGLELQFGPDWPCCQRRDAQSPALPRQVLMSCLPSFLSQPAGGHLVKAPWRASFRLVDT